MVIESKRIPRFFVFAIFIWCTYACNWHQDASANHVKWADSVADKAFNIMTTANSAHSLTYIDSVYAATGYTGIADLWRKYNVKVNYFTNYHNDTAQRRILIDSMFSVLKGHENEYKFELSHALYLMADVLKAEKKYAQSFKYYYDGRIIAETSQDYCSLIDFSNHLGTIRYQQGQYQQALPYLKQAFKETGNCTSNDFYYNFILPQSILNTTALCFERLGKPDSAVVYYDKALKFIQSRITAYPQKQIFVYTALGVVEGNLGGTYAKINNFDLAEKYLKEDITINDRPEYAIEDAQTAKLKLVSLYINNNRLPQADALLTQLQHDLLAGRGKSAANDEVWTNWYNYKWQYFNKLNDVTNAYHFMKKYHTFTDSLAQLNNGLKHLDLDESLKDHEQQYQLNLLRKNDQLKTAYIVGASVFLLMAMGIMLYIWVNFKRTRKNNIELTNLNAQMRVANGALEQSQEDNTRMMKIAAHDLRNPIGAMTSVASLILDEIDKDDDNYPLLETMKISGENALQLVDDLLQINMPAADLKTEPVELSSLIQYCADMLKHKLEAKKQRLELHTVPVTLSLNHEKIWRVISNLVSNAIKFSPVGAAIVINLEKQESNVLLSVQDFGIGIPLEVQDKIFDIFTEARRVGTGGEESYGLGLAISKQIIELHGGKIWFVSTPGKGTTFYVELS
jgi:signal transduction histidine kinase